MVKPAPKIYHETVNPITGDFVDVVSGNGIFAVFFQGNPINVRRHYKDPNNGLYHYTNLLFVNSGHAFRQARKLNNLFHTKDFTVVELDTSYSKVITDD